MVGDIYFERADIIVAPLAIISMRFPYVDYIYPITHEIGKYSIGK